MFRITACILLILSFYTSSAQSNSDRVEELYKEITIEKIFQTQGIFNEVNDLIENKSLTDEEYLKLIITLANLYEISGKRSEAIKVAKKGIDISISKEMYLWQAGFEIFISKSYRRANMIDFSERTLLQAIKISKKAPRDENFFIFNINAYYELAAIASIHSNYDQFSSHIRCGNYYASKLENKQLSKFYIAVNHQLAGDFFNSKNQSDSALVHLNKGLNLLENTYGYNANILKNYIYTHMSKSFLDKNDLESAKYYLDLVLNDSINQQPLKLAEELNQNLSNYYKYTNNLDQFEIFQKKNDSITHLKKKDNILLLNDLTKEISIRPEENENFDILNYWYLGGIPILGFIIFRKYKSKKKSKQVDGTKILNKNVYAKKSIDNSEEDIQKIKDLPFEDLPFEELPFEELIEKSNLIDELKPEEIYIARETENRLIDLIKEFETEEGYLNHSITQSMLAVKFHTNAKYITYVIRKLYDKDFNSYINELRINYIIKQFEKNTKFRQYKISYLAEIAGFSSHSKFGAVFKKIKGCSPSEYITSLENKNS